MLIAFIVTVSGLGIVLASIWAIIGCALFGPGAVNLISSDLAKDIASFALVALWAGIPMMAIGGFAASLLVDDGH